jgi:endonuclease-3
MKAKNLLGMARAVVERHGGEIPDTMEALVELPGVARKTGNVVLGSALGVHEGIVVDTHVTRLAGRLGLTRETDPVKIEHDLMELLPREQWTPFGHRLIWHGRRVCFARNPDCEHCILAPVCPSAFAVTAEPSKPKPAKPTTKAKPTTAKSTTAKSTTAKSTTAKSTGKRSTTKKPTTKPEPKRRTAKR